MAVTIYDVAKRAGVGIGTVSRVLNESPNVRAETRDRVLQAIAALDYRPSSIARRLSLRKTLTIGVIAPFFTRPSVVERLRGIEAIVAQSDYDLVVYNVETPAHRDAYFESIPTSNRVDGLIVISLRPQDEDVAFWQKTALPIVLVDADHPALHRIVIDDVAGGYMAVQHLIAQGHRKIAYVSDPLDNPFQFGTSSWRYQGYQKALSEQGFALRADYHLVAPHGRTEARDLTRRLLELNSPPTAIFAASDTQAFGVIEAAREMGVRIPEDLSVIGYDDIEVAELLNLTTIRQPLFESGKRGIELLLYAIDNPGDVPVREQLPLELVLRGSTAAPAG